MNAEDRLSEGLRELARSSSPPSPALKATLQSEFHRHHARRRRTRMAVLLGVAACLAAVPFLVQNTFRGGHSASGAKGTIPATSRAPESAAFDRGWSALEASDFVTLPSYDPAIPVEGARLVRLQMPGSALSLVGMPVRQDAADRQFVADVLLAQDGTPFALRLVNQ
jgi:hypothetical protein